MKKPPTIHVATITVIDPDTKNFVEVEIRKDPESGAMVGIDGSYLDNTDDPIYSPYNRGRTLNIPDDEMLPAYRPYVVKPEQGPVVVFETFGNGATARECAESAFDDLKQPDSFPLCTVVFPDGTTHEVDLGVEEDDGTDEPRGAHDASFREESGELLLFPNNPKGAQWIAKNVTTNVADTIHFSINHGREVVKQMRDDGLNVIEAKR